MERKVIDSSVLLKELIVLVVSLMMGSVLLFKAMEVVISGAYIIGDGPLPALTLVFMNFRGILLQSVLFFVLVLFAAVLIMLVELVVVDEHKFSFMIYRFLNIIMLLFNSLVLIGIFLPFARF